MEAGGGGQGGSQVGPKPAKTQGLTTQSCLCLGAGPGQPGPMHTSKVICLVTGGRGREVKPGVGWNGVQELG